ncbi:regulatory protein RecX [Acinetobacter sp. 194]|uniref:regulatory protein RecX n=1 Tax=Acinetobacter shaoyimingii TaxID=2715164 RepID=UPI00140AC3DB|nr:regulatory protein RecX [Acinetobacter shaoyimingii]NHB57395.1 regulatory protein RecX [Acinetobacter shaoyimingii]
MTEAKFPKIIDYEALKREFEELDPPADSKKPLAYHSEPQDTQSYDSDDSTSELDDGIDPTEKKPVGLTGTRLRSYAFAVLTRKEYSKKDLIEKLCLYAQNRNEVLELVDELARENYQSDKRVAEMTVRSQIRKGKGPNRIKLALKAKSIDKDLAKDDMAEVDWYEEAYQIKVKKYGVDVATDPKLKAKQIRFLQYRGFDMDAIMKAIKRKNDDE